ncbi:pilus assembly PilX N-terminal domain-containing protein [Thioalkalivibrio sp.]|uniref:pilus assembly PilX N-terminal domain-containing protein n=2 Tax=Thioalkalivibrio sp. TaxID=2093813 RepID=UPI003975006E
MAPGMRSGRRGIALAVVLVLLAVGSLIAVTGMTQAIVDERIAGNQRQVAEIFLAAEAGLLHAGRWWQEETWGERHDQLFWGDPEGAMAALGALDRVIRPGLSWSVQELRFDGDEVLMRVRGQIEGIGTVREVQGRYRRPSGDDPADANGALSGWTELLQH